MEKASILFKRKSRQTAWNVSAGLACYLCVPLRAGGIALQNLVSSEGTSMTVSPLQPTE